MNVNEVKIRTLNDITQLKSIVDEKQEVIETLYDLNISITESVLFDGGYDALIISMIAERFEDSYNIDDWIGWWLYEDVEKTIWVGEDEFNVKTPEGLVEFLFKNYKIKLVS